MINIGELVKQGQHEYSAFIPHAFPPKDIPLSKETLKMVDTASRKLGNLNGIAHQLPNIDFFLFMYIRKDATASSQIEGTNATLAEISAIEIKEAPIDEILPRGDVNEILSYIQALNLGVESLAKIPISERLIKMVHKELMKNGRKTQEVAPGEFRKTQNWIRGSSPSNARFVPPPAHELQRTISDLEKFIHNEDTFLPIVKMALMHAQFEVIHPFLDGNGRTGRMLIPLYLKEKDLLEKPVLFLSWYFNKHREQYFDLLFEYGKGNVDSWVYFFAQAVTFVCDEAIKVSEEVSNIRQRDMEKIQAFSSKTSERAITLLNYLFEIPIITTADVVKLLGISRSSARNSINKMIENNILYIQPDSKEYGKRYIYKDYFDAFNR